MHSERGVEQFKAALLEVEAQGGKIEFGGKVGAALFTAEFKRCCGKCVFCLL